MNIYASQKFAVGDAVYHYAKDIDAVYRFVVTGVQAYSRDVNSFGGGTWTITYFVQQPNGSTEPEELCEDELWESPSRAFREADQAAVNLPAPDVPCLASDLSMPANVGIAPPLDVALKLSDA